MIHVWHNPRCSKSRNCLAFLDEKGVSYEVVKYLDDGPSKEDLEAVLKKLNMQPRELMRTKEAIYKELGLKDVSDDTLLIDAMLKNPKLIERPIVIKGDKAAIARPIENIEVLLA